MSTDMIKYDTYHLIMGLIGECIGGLECVRQC